MTREELILLRCMEECNEVSQRISKALNFGMEEVQDHPAEQNPERLNNFERIRREYVDLVATMEMAGFTLSMVFDDEVMAKQDKIERYLKKSMKEGRLT